MAAELGITAGAYAKIERGETDASFTRLVNIAEILGIALSGLLGEQQIVSKMEEPAGSYGFASKAEIEKLSQLIKSISHKIEKLETEMASIRKGKSKQSK